MPIAPESIAVGKCYLSNMNFVRHIISINQEMVTLEERGTKPVPRPWGQKKPVLMDRFIQDVTLEVPADFDPELPEDNE